jgi:cobalt/nickel transport system permease protein
MHMADALISPAVGGVFWAAAAGLIGYSSKKIRKESEMDEKKIPLMGVMGAFIFAAQMINFTIPGTGSSGHLGGGMICAILLGAPAAFLTMASVLTIQAFFFADGGLLSLGCNIFNLAFYPCFLAYPFLYKKIAGSRPRQAMVITGSLISAIISLQLGALSVVLQTMLSGKSDIPFGTFLLMMQPIHLAIGIIEGIVTSAVVMFVWNARPEILEAASAEKPVGNIAIARVVTVLTVLTVLTGGMLSWFASSHPDGLEWSIFKATGTEELKSPEEGIHASLAEAQEKTAILPNYGFKPSSPEGSAEEAKPAWPAVDSGTSVSGIIGGAITLVLAVCIGLLLKGRKKTDQGFN